MRSGRHVYAKGKTCFVARYLHMTTGESFDYIFTKNRSLAETYAKDTAHYCGAEFIELIQGTVPVTLHKNEHFVDDIG